MNIPSTWFHGSEDHFAAFDYEKIGSQQGRNSRGFWFSSDEHAACYYGPNVVQCSLDLQCPLLVSTEMYQEAGQSPAAWAHHAHDLGHCSVIIEDVCDGDVPSTVICVFSTDNIRDLRWRLWDEERHERVDVSPGPVSLSRSHKLR